MDKLRYTHLLSFKREGQRRECVYHPKTVTAVHFQYTGCALYIQWVFGCACGILYAFSFRSCNNKFYD